MDRKQFEYITSEKFIHDNLLRSAQRVIDTACQQWEAGEKLASHALVWPSRDVIADEGSRIDGAIIMKMPARAEWNRALRALVEKTYAYGLLLLDSQENKIVGKFETAHGARSWTIPIQWHGDRRMLGGIKVNDNRECVGLLWSPHQGTA